MGFSRVSEVERIIPLTVSVVSHGHGAMVEALLWDLSLCPQIARVVLTHNIAEEEISCPQSLLQRTERIRNKYPLGFGANHNQAFRLCETELFAVLNPDIRFPNDPFPQLAALLDLRRAGVVGPTVVDPEGRLEDSARRFPTAIRLVRKLILGNDGSVLLKDKSPCDVDWLAGMFLLFSARAFRECGGFDEQFHLYYEDVDICTRLWRRNWRVILDPRVFVVHAAQRDSRRNFRYAIWHLSSMLRYLTRTIWRLPR